MRSLFLCSTLALSSIVFTACPEGASGPDAEPADASPTCIEARTHDDFDWIEVNIFEPSCSRFSVCHQGGVAAAAMLDLTREVAISETVDVDSVQQPGMKIIAPGDPANSYMMVKLGRGDQSLLGITRTMPFNNPLLCDDKIDAIERWIQGGAQPPPDAAPMADAATPDAGPDADPADAP